MQAPLPVIMITAYGDIAIAVKAMKAGAFDFLQKPANPKELLDCIERALNYSPEHPEHSSLQANRNGESRQPHGRQRQILQLVLAGHPSKNIAADLRISQRTVDNHRAAIMRKTEAKSLSALIRIALAAGWLDEPAGAQPPHKQNSESILSKRHNYGCGIAPPQGVRNAAIALRCSMRSQMILQLAKSGTASSAPGMPQIQPRKIIAMKTATGLSKSRRLTMTGTVR